MIRIRIIAIAITSRMWMKPPSVYDETMPSSHNTMSSTRIVVSMPTEYALPGHARKRVNPYFRPEDP